MDDQERGGAGEVELVGKTVTTDLGEALPNRAGLDRSRVTTDSSGSVLMKTSLEHLPESKREQLRALTEALCSFAPVDLVILFGSYARGDWVEDLENGYFSDYDILVVVKDVKLAADDLLWGRASQRLHAMTGRVPVTLLVHDLRYVNHEIRTGQYFFSDIVLEGVVLHRTRGTQLAKPKAMNNTERLRLGERSFRYWYHSASEFWHGSAYYAARGELAAAAFLLHQATERYFHAVLLVYTNYKPKTHDIELLANQTAAFHPSLSPVLPRSQPEDERLFKLLKRAYIEARYSKSYKITLEELTILREHVRVLAVCVREASIDELATHLGADAVAVGELPTEPRAEDSNELPTVPPLEDAHAVECWRNAIAELSREAGRREGHESGVRQGRELGLQEGRTQALVEVLRLRGLALTEADVARVMACSTASQIDEWWSRALTIEAASDLFDGARDPDLPRSLRR